MKTTTVKSDFILLLTAAIWGFAFVAQRVGMEFVGPFFFNGIRFALGTLVLIPVWFLLRKRLYRRSTAPDAGLSAGRILAVGALAGGALFLGSSFQQVGIVYTTAGKAGFITGLYVVLVPLTAAFFGRRTTIATWAGAVLAAAGLYLLSVTSQFTIQIGDLLVLCSAFFWTAHVLILAKFASRIPPVKLAIMQFAACSVLSMAVSLFTEQTTVAGAVDAVPAILYGGVMSVGIAYTLQIVGQKHAHPAHAAIILSLEGVFAVIGGTFLLNEALSARGWAGCALMLAGMLLSQLGGYVSMRRSIRKKSIPAEEPSTTTPP